MDIRIGKLTVLIGEQATGKSTLGKLLAVCKDFKNVNPGENNTESSYESIVDYGMGNFVNQNSYLAYSSKEYTITSKIDWRESVEHGNERLGIPIERSEYPILHTDIVPISKHLKRFFDRIEMMTASEEDDLYRYYEYLSDFKGQYWGDALYAYAERNLQSVFSLGKSSIEHMSDKLFAFLANIDRIARTFSNGLTIDSLAIEYKNHNGIGYFRKMGSEKYHKMQNAASGYQSVVPIVLLVEYYTQIRKKKKTFIIEEPELNLFPTTQHRLMQYLVSNLNQTENQILITTHSPYVLAALNNMLNGYKSGQIDKERTAAILPESYWLNPADVTAYRLMADGTAKDLMNREVDMIHSEEIDEASEVLNENFDALLSIQLKHENG